MKKPKCICCDVKLEYRPVETKRNGVTHIWVCPECPFVGFEYYNKTDAKRLSKSLNNS